MTTNDAYALEAAFAVKTERNATDRNETSSDVIDNNNAEEGDGDISGDAPPELKRTKRAARSRETQSISVRSVVVLSKPLRRRDREHLKFVGTQPCVVCGRQPSDAHHLKFAQQPAMGRKVSDEYAVSLCRHHHRELHRRGDERIWWRQLNIDPLPIAEKLWQQTRLRTPETDSQDRSEAGGSFHFDRLRRTDAIRKEVPAPRLKKANADRVGTPCGTDCAPKPS